MADGNGMGTSFPDSYLNIFYRFGLNITKWFWGNRILFLISAVLVSVLFAKTGLDWLWLQLSSKYDIVQQLFIGAALIGIPVPILSPVVAFFVAKKKQNRKMQITALAMGQSVILSIIISTFFKIFTGRVAPEPFKQIGSKDFSQDFRFGFLEGHGIWDTIVEGWPSGHTMAAFAMVTSLIIFYADRRWLKALCLVYAIYIGLGVSTTIHWLSDAIAGGLIGIAIGLTVGECFIAVESN